MNFIPRPFEWRPTFYPELCPCLLKLEEGNPVSNGYILLHVFFIILSEERCIDTDQVWKV
jgi:hypothetical protein